MSSIVFFGQADAGKSTLAGYIVARFDKEFKFSKFIESMKKVNPQYDTRLAYSSIINTNRDEIEDLQHLNSRAIHLRKVDLPFENVTIIDTPGSENYKKQRERGIYYGNVGVFFMEINNILEHKYTIDTIAPIALWSKLKNKRMIFLLTKFDMLEYAEDAYYNALGEVENICRYFGFSGEVTVIPTAIEVDRIKELKNDNLNTIELGENICLKSERMPWFNGKTVIDAIKVEIDELDQKDETEPLMFCITDQINRPDNRAGKVWNIKILSGILKVGQEICLAPVKDTNNNFRVLTANIKLLRSDISRFDKKDEVAVARKGEIYGMDIRNCYIDKGHVSKSEYDVISSSCGFGSSTKFKMSDCFVFEINLMDGESFDIGKEMRLVWLGRSLPFLVKEIDGVIVLGQLKSTQIAFPIFGNGISESILIKGNDSIDFYNCRLLKIGND
ncbi:MAG: GTP-binding protein [Acinetobacter sp.]